MLTPEQVQMFQRLCPGKKPDDPVSTAPEGGAWHFGVFHAHRWRLALDAANTAGLTKRPRVHDLRHTHASWLIAGKVPLPVIQARPGHESITTTVDRYGHLLDSSDVEAVAAVEWATSAVAPQALARLPESSTVGPMPSGPGPTWGVCSPRPRKPVTSGEVERRQPAMTAMRIGHGAALPKARHDGRNGRG